MSELTITTSHIPGDPSATILHLQGHLHGSTESLLHDHVRVLHEKGIRRLLLDLSELEVLSSAGLRVIQNTFKMFTPSGDLELMHKPGAEPYKSPYVKLVCPNPQIYYILNITGFMQNMPVYNNMEDAVRSFGG